MNKDIKELLLIFLSIFVAVFLLISIGYVAISTANRLIYTKNCRIEITVEENYFVIDPVPQYLLTLTNEGPNIGITIADHWLKPGYSHGSYSNVRVKCQNKE